MLQKTLFRKPRDRYAAAWDESKHPRGQPQNAGQFVDAAGKSMYATATESGRQFKTGVPVSFPFVRNTEKAPKPSGGDLFQQNIEPAGRYLLHHTTDSVLPGWQSGQVSFKNPLVINLSHDKSKIYGDNSWKKNLSLAFGGKTGSSLSKAIANRGYDGIVTVDELGNTSEPWPNGWGSP